MNLREVLRIDSLAFGSIVINGKRYTSDLIIYPDGHVEDSWHRKSGHKLSSEDIKQLIESNPEVIIAGTGVNGRVKPERTLLELLLQKGIQFFPEKNQKAQKRYNQMGSEKRVGACFHLTC